jgi:hypothetical protein
MQYASLGSTPAVNSLLTFTGTPNVQFTANLTITGAFTAGADEVCAPATGTITATPSADAGTAGTDLADFLVEASGGADEICFPDSSYNTGAGVQVYLSRTGAATTAPFQSAIGSDAGAGEDWQFIYFVPSSTPLYNGTTLSFPTTTGTGETSGVLLGVGPGLAEVTGYGPTMVTFAP